MTDNVELKSLVYQQLKNDHRIHCTKDEFNQHIKAFRTEQGVYIELFQHMDETEITHVTNKLLNVTSEDLIDFKNACDWLVRQDVKVWYMKELDIYLLADDEIDTYIKL